MNNDSQNKEVKELYDNLNEPYWEWDLKENSVYYSAHFMDLLGHKAKSHIDNPSFWHQYLAPEVLTDVKKQLKLHISDRSVKFDIKIPITNKQSKPKWINMTGASCEVNKGRCIKMAGFFRDITEEEKNVEKLKLSTLVNHTINAPIFFINEENNIVYQDLFSQKTSHNTSLFDYIDFSISEFIGLKDEAKKLGKIIYNNISFDNFNNVFNISVTYEKDAQIYIWIVENITTKFHEEQQQVISNRLALLGNTFSNISHDFNNVLSVTLGSIELLELKAAQGEDLSKYIDRMKGAIDKGKKVTERLLAFTRQPRADVIQFDPIKEIKDNLYLFEQLLLDTVDFNFVQDNAHCVINFPHGEFINMLLNLIINANDAIQKQSLDGKILLSANINSDGRLEIHIKDSGIGIAKDKISQIFDPFYTSKSINKGNGIGLANVYNTMYKHNGQILVDGHGDLGGADFTLLFKCQVLHQNKPKKMSNKSSSNIKDKQILILDDETSIAEFVTSHLNSKGAESTFISTKVALEETLNQNKHFDIFIADMILPDITGAEAIALVLAQYPHIKIYSISGYLSLKDRNWPHPVLRKPFNSEELEAFLENN